MTCFKKISKLISLACGSKRISLLLCLAAGALGALPYYFEKLFIFTFISYFSIFCIILKQAKIRNSLFMPFFAYYIGFFTPIYLFLAEIYPYSDFGFEESQAVFVLICSCVVIPLLHATVEAGIMSVFSYFKSPASLLFGASALFVIGEWVLSLGTLAFPWTSTAVSLTEFLPYLQTASVFGKYFITFITVFGCMGLALAVDGKKRLFAIIGASVLLLNTVFGTVLWFMPTERGEEFTSAAIQGNILANEKWDTEANGSIFDRYIELTEEAASNGADMIILPETAIPQAFVPNGNMHREFARIANDYSVTIVAGVNYYDIETKGYYNAVIAVLPDGTGTLSEHYDKRHLVPFGEFLPFAEQLSKWIPFIEAMNQSRISLYEGSEPIIIDTEHGAIGPLVCFDSIFPQFSREAVQNGAEIIAVVTNDSWFNDSAGTYTHLRHSQIRAIENRRFILRAANTGVSAYIDEHGRIEAQTEPLVKDILYSSAYSIEERSVYSYIGDVFLYISFAILAVITAINTIITIRSRKNGNNQAS